MRTQRGTFSKEQVEENSYRFVGSFGKDKPTKGPSKNQVKQKRKGRAILKNTSKTIEVQAIINAKSFDIEEGRILMEIEDKYIEIGLEFPGVPSATPPSNEY